MRVWATARRPLDVFDLKLRYVVNNLVRGAAGGAVLNSELFTRGGIKPH
jgi:hypothetical protein